MPSFGETPVKPAAETPEEKANRFGENATAVATETPQAIAEAAEAQMVEDHATADELVAKIINGEVGTVTPEAEGEKHDAHVGAFARHTENEENSRLAEESRISRERFAEQIKKINEQAEKFVSKLGGFKLIRENVRVLSDGKIIDAYDVFGETQSLNRLYELCESFVNNVPGEMQSTFASARSKMEVVSDSSETDRLKGESIAKTFEAMTSSTSRINQTTLDQIPKDVIKAAQLLGNMQIDTSLGEGTASRTAEEQKAFLQKRNGEKAGEVQEIVRGL